MKIDGVGINHVWAASLTQDAFVKEMSGEGYAHLWPDVKNRVGKLKEVHSFCKKKAGNVEEPVKDQEPQQPAAE